MRLILDPAEDAAHLDWLRVARGAYEWWYFDALSDDRQWALTCIWFLGNPFSPYYRDSVQGCSGDPLAHNALFFALYRDGHLHAYHFTRFPKALICADEARPAVRFGDSTLARPDGADYVLHVSDENANRRRVVADLRFTAPLLQVQPSRTDAVRADTHFWLPAVPACRVSGQILLHNPQNPGPETIIFSGHGYHDHNWGTLPFARDIRDWYWARITLGPARALLLYHVRQHHAPPVTHLLLFDGGRLLCHEEQAVVTLRRRRLNGFGTVHATELAAVGGELSATVALGARLDSAPFYLRALCEGHITHAGCVEQGEGLGEYFRPRMMSQRLVASAMKARIVER